MACMYRPISLEYVRDKWTKMYVMKWLYEQRNDETLEGFSKSVKQTKWASALAYDEPNIHVKWVE